MDQVYNSLDPTQFNLNNIQLIDRGNVALAINNAIKAIMDDVIERNGEKGTRKVAIEILAKPKNDKRGMLESVTVAFKIKPDIPPRVSDPYPMLAMGDHQVVFKPGSPMDPRVNTPMFDEMQEAKDEQAGEPVDPADTDASQQ